MPASPTSLRITNAYHAALARVERRITGAVVGQYRRISRRELARDFHAFVASADVAIAGGQAQARRLAAAYLGAYYAAETRDEPLALPVSGDVGTTVDGRPLASALSATPAKVLAMVGAGRAVADALRFGQSSVARMASTEVLDAARSEITIHITARDEMVGWRWVNYGRSCPACLSQSSGAVRDPDHPMNPHPHCDCTMEPVIAGVRERVSRPTGTEQFRRMTPAQQAEVAGSVEHAAALRAGRISLDDYVRVQPAKQWRENIAIEQPAL
jgi:hypothetical protein